MAYTVARKKYVANTVVNLLDITADAAEANLSTGLSVITHYNITFQSMTTVVGPKFVPNKTSTATAANGTLGISGLTSGDRFFVTIYGR